MKEVLSQFDLPAIEKNITDFWEKNQIVQKYLKRNEKSKRRFSFLDGPITANNPMGVHHGWGRTLKDLYQRYKNMRGFKERFQNGFDNQGLWVEVEVEKKLGFKNKKDIEAFGIDKFVQLCKEHTLSFAKIQTEQSKRLGYFMDWDNSYYTLSDENNYAIWHFLKICWQNKWLYKGEDVVHWCPRCGTAISQHETLTGDYADLTHKAVYVKYPILGKDKEFFLVWTTTPWTLPANAAVAVNPEINYIKVKMANGEVLILAKSRQQVLGQDFKVLEEISGKDLLGLKYIGPYDDLEIVKKSLKEHLLVAWKEGVLESEGTGLVHMSPGSGPEDYDLAKKIGLPVFPVLDESGNYITGYNDLTGKKAAQIAPVIIEDLQKKGFLFKAEDFTHRYPLCWRCKTELLFRLVDEWYISMEELRGRMMKITGEIRWIPEFGKKLEMDWLKNMEDWLISKKRYWGLCLPIWECETCHYFEVVGSKKELQEKAISGWQEFEGHSPHRPWVDKVQIKCSQCQKPISRIKDVGNPWLDAGIISFSTLKYFSDKNYWQQWFPADLVLECFPGQFKNWFYSLLAMSAGLENTKPFKTLLGHALVRDEKGKEMHKSSGNAIEFNEGAKIMGADLMRWLYVRQSPELNLNFGFSLAKKIKKEFLLIFWNCYKFFVDYVSLDGISPKEIAVSQKDGPGVLDQWILSRLNTLIKLATNRLDDFDHSTAILAIEDFVINDFSTWYIRRSRDRVGPGALDHQDKLRFYQTSYRVLTVLLKLMAPFVPFLTEEIYQNLVEVDKKDSLHLEDWPEFEPKLIKPDLEEKMVLVRQVCGFGHAIRKEAGIKNRQPLRKLKFKNEKLKTKTINDELKQLIAAELNVKEVEITDKITDNDNERWAVKAEGEITVSLNKEISEDLRKEGLVREVVRTIQEMRKKQGLKPQNQIQVSYWATGALKNALSENQEKVVCEVIATDFSFQDQDKITNGQELILDGERIIISITKI
jgi:isoleucyl-tRNA synthetase